jgi:hypothetical protein
MYKSLLLSLPIIAIAATSSAPVFADDNGIASALHTLRGEGRQVCQVGHFHVGKSPYAYANKAKAMRAAVRHWSEFTALEYGSDWGHFKLAASKTTECEKETATTWVCKVRARPCRRGLTTAAR